MEYRGVADAQAGQVGPDNLVANQREWIVGENVQIVVIGCGAIGLPIAVAFASRGADVLGVDNDAQLIAKLAAADSQLLDDGLQEAMKRSLAAGNIRFAQSPGHYPGRRVLVLAVPTPVDDRGRWVRESIDDAFAQALSFARDDDLLVIKSTVPVGTARSLATRSRDIGRKLHVAACPDRSIAGMSFRDQFALPHIIGGVSDRAAEMAAKEFARLGAVRVVENAEAAELLKLFANVQRDVMFALANEFALICDNLDIAFDELVKTAKEGYPRFDVANPGWVGGPCLPKGAYLLAESVPGRPDLVSLALRAREANVAILTRCTRAINECAKRLPHPVIAVLGLAFKGRPPTRDQRCSLGNHLVATLAKQIPGAVIRTWDPEAMNPQGTALETVEGSDILVMANNHSQVLALPPKELASVMRSGGTIFDLSGAPREAPNDLPNDVDFRSLGSGSLATVQREKKRWRSLRNLHDVTRGPNFRPSDQR
jgi:UDP-N-acetyl-D-mannosaminuronic acid dehydrogenase